MWGRLLLPGGDGFLDDYAYCGYRAQKLAMDELSKELGFAIASLPTGQGLVVKPQGA